MKWNPVLSAVAAAAYIGLVALLIQHINSLRHDTPDTLLDSIGVLSLLVFSAATMAFLFFYQPTCLVIENKRAAAVAYFLKTLGAFGVIVGIVLTLVILQ